MRQDVICLRDGSRPGNEIGRGLFAVDRNRAMEQEEACLRWLGSRPDIETERGMFVGSDRDCVR